MGRLIRAYASAIKMFPPMQPRELTAHAKSSITSISQRLMLETGLIEHAGSSGLYFLLPLATRALEKLERIIHDEMAAIGAQRIRMPTLADRQALIKTGRWDTFGNDLFRMDDRHGETFCLAPTHEEAVTSLASTRLHEMSPTQATPLLLYQMTSKFRDERRPRSGLLRCREFLMKDMYSFDVDQAGAEQTYELCSDAYRRLFRDRLGLSSSTKKSAWMRVRSDVGAMGGTLSHEFHLANETCGEDRIDYCTDCESGVNRELVKDQDDDKPTTCPECRRERRTIRTVELAHTFVLGTKYSEAFDAYFKTDRGSALAYMGCYGIGVTRLLASLIDANMNVRKERLRWPLAIAPYRLCVIVAKAGSREEAGGATRFAYEAVEALADMKHLRGEILVDDRTDFTVGRRLVDAKRLGFPYVVVANKSVVKEPIPMFELFDLTGGDGEEEPRAQLVTHDELFDRMRRLGDLDSFW